MNTKQKIRKLMQHNGMDQWTLAPEIGLKRSTLHSIMAGEVEPGRDLLPRVNRYLTESGLCPLCASKLQYLGTLGFCLCSCGWDSGE